MNQFEKMAAMAQELKALAKKYDISIVVSRQFPRPQGFQITTAPQELPDVIYLDYMDKIGPVKKGEE